MLTWDMLWRLRQRGIVPVIKCTAEVEDLRIIEVSHRQKELMDEMDKLDKEIRSRIEPEYYSGPLYDSDPECKHILTEESIYDMKRSEYALIECSKCGGWFTKDSE